MQRQLEKITDLVQLIVQKMEIRTEITNDDRLKVYDNDENPKTPQLRKTSNVIRRIRRLRPSGSRYLSDPMRYNSQ